MKQIVLAIAFLFAVATFGQATSVYKGYKTAQMVKRTDNHPGQCQQGKPSGYAELYVKQATTYYYETSNNTFSACMNASGWSKLVYNICGIPWSQGTTGTYYVDAYSWDYWNATRYHGGSSYTYTSNWHETSGSGSITICKDSWHSLDPRKASTISVYVGAHDVNNLGTYCVTTSDSK